MAMNKSHEMPAWFMQDIDEDAPNVIVATTVVFEREERYFFAGVVASILQQGKIPHSIDIALDGEAWSCVDRLTYGIGTDGDATSPQFEVSSFALLWTASATKIHGAA